MKKIMESLEDLEKLHVKCCDDFDESVLDCDITFEYTLDGDGPIFKYWNELYWEEIYNCPHCGENIHIK